MPFARVPDLKARREAQQLFVQTLAREAKVTERIITTLEAGGTCEPAEAARLEAVLSGPSPAPVPVESVESVESGESVDAIPDRD